ncbi:hypothetical protein RJ641_032041 [Dillenia turbinata]|uniref:Uncharacterized protein n=1 Tax=Dillenia turbinata TaxID=194707 RepID=A0AAN8W253_9MAGN
MGIQILKLMARPRVENNLGSNAPYYPLPRFHSLMALAHQLGSCQFLSSSWGRETLYLQTSFSFTRVVMKDICALVSYVNLIQLLQTKDAAFPMHTSELAIEVQSHHVLYKIALEWNQAISNVHNHSYVGIKTLILVAELVGKGFAWLLQLPGVMKDICALASYVNLIFDNFVCKLSKFDRFCSSNSGDAAFPMHTSELAFEVQFHHGLYKFVSEPHYHQNFLTLAVYTCVVLLALWSSILIGYDLIYPNDGTFTCLFAENENHWFHVLTYACPLLFQSKLASWWCLHLVANVRRASCWSGIAVTISLQKFLWGGLHSSSDCATMQIVSSDCKDNHGMREEKRKEVALIMMVVHCLITLSKLLAAITKIWLFLAPVLDDQAILSYFEVQEFPILDFPLAECVVRNPGGVEYSFSDVCGTIPSGFQENIVVVLRNGEGSGVPDKPDAEQFSAHVFSLYNLLHGQPHAIVEYGKTLFLIKHHEVIIAQNIRYHHYNLVSLQGTLPTFGDAAPSLYCFIISENLTIVMSASLLVWHGFPSSNQETPQPCQRDERVAIQTTSVAAIVARSINSELLKEGYSRPCSTIAKKRGQKMYLVEQFHSQQC